MTRRRRRWPVLPKMSRLVDGQLTASALIEAFTVLRADGPDDPMTLDEVKLWLELHVESPRPPSPSTVPGLRGARRRRSYNAPAGRPGQRRPSTEAAAA